MANRQSVWVLRKRRCLRKVLGHQVLAWAWRASKNVAVTGRCLESSTRDMVTRFSLLIWFGRIFAKKRQRNLNGSKQTNVAKGWWGFCFMCWFLTQEDAGCSALSVKKHGCGRCAYPVKISWLARLFATVNSIGLLLMHFECMKVPKYQWYALQFE